MFSPARSTLCLERARILGDHFVQLQTAIGRPDPARTPFARPWHPFVSGHLHSPPFFARACYRLYDATGEVKYLDAADRFCVFGLAVVRDPAGEGDDWYRDRVLGAEAGNEARRAEERDLLARPWAFGMLLDNYFDFKTHHPEETCFDSKGEALYRWLQFYRWDRPGYFRVGYARGNFPDNGFTDDLSHVGRGLIQYYKICNQDRVLSDAVGLAGYFLAALRPHSDVGVFNERLGTWAVGPWPVVGFEHLDTAGAHEVGWGYGARDATEFLLLLYPFADAEMQERIAERCVSSLRWQFATCQFDDGALGLFQRDDEWLGMTAGAVLNYRELAALDLLPAADRAYFEDRAARAADWLIDHSTVEFAIDRMGYQKVSGFSHPNHRENAGWLTGWTIEALLKLAREEKR